MVPSAPRMSPTCAESSAAPRSSWVFAVVVVMANAPFTASSDGGIGGHCDLCRRVQPAVEQRQEGLITGRPGSAGRLGSAGGQDHRLTQNGVRECPEQAGTLASRAVFGPDYRGPLLASLRPAARAAPCRQTPLLRRRTPGPWQAPLSLELWHFTA